MRLDLNEKYFDRAVVHGIKNLESEDKNHGPAFWNKGFIRMKSFFVSNIFCLEVKYAEIIKIEFPEDKDRRLITDYSLKEKRKRN